LKQNKPNIIWYCTDQQRYDTIRSLGNEFINTPNIDRLVSSGVSFLNAYCQSPICTPSRASFLTGKYPATHQVFRNGNAFFPDDQTLVTKILTDNGYDCGLIGKLHLSRGDILEKRPKNDGYRYFKWSHHPNPDYPEGHDYAIWLEEKGVNPIELYSKLSGAIGAGVPDELHQTTWCTEMALNFINEDRQGPWMLSINPFDPHPPFDPPPEYLSRYNPEDLPLPIFQDSDIEHQKLFKDIDQQTREAIDPRKYKEMSSDVPEVPRGDLGSVPPKHYDPQLVKAYYYAMIEKIDQSVGVLIDELERLGELENTIFIFTSDHGELLGDHGLIYKGCRFFESLVHIPLVISWPTKFSQNVRKEALVETIDIAPMLLEVAGIAIPEDMQGKSLIPLLVEENLDGKQIHKEFVSCEYHGAIGGDIMTDQTHGVMYFDGKYKVCVYHGHEVGEIYDLENDPSEFNNLWFSSDFQNTKADLINRAFLGYLGTIGPGVERTGVY
jgi:arylsulfatase